MILVAAIALVIALGKVEQQTSYGLQDTLGGLLVLSPLRIFFSLGFSGSFGSQEREIRRGRNPGSRNNQRTTVDYLVRRGLLKASVTWY